jgi:long-subunit acyl-CoA synthetase (AMP-forming)
VRAQEFDFYLTDLRAKALIVQRGDGSPAVEVAKARGMTIFELSPMADDEAGLFTLNGDRLIGREGGHYSESSDVALVLHTSGTTSRPKIVPLTVANLSASARNVAASLLLSRATDV